MNPAPMSASWLALIREDTGGQTFWRIYVRSLFQDGSHGKPVGQRPWDLNARYRGDPRSYDQGGEYGAPLEGYWVDFTELAARYGWERLPALINWRTYYPATLFGTFVYRDGLTWQAAMAQMYPPEAVSSPTPWYTLTPTVTLTPTLYYQRLITPSITPTVTLTATLHPTLTPAPKSP
jgi:TolB protein